tara:strand:- start:87 stop:431 length:345 start_codon:yes stop_codon:yes gene_type:complete
MEEQFLVLNKEDTETRSKIKNLIYYCTKCSYEVSLSNYDKLDDIIKDSKSIRLYGNEPSVRRAIRLINNDNKVKDIIICVMSETVRGRVAEEEQLRLETKPKFKVSKGSHTIVF